MSDSFSIFLRISALKRICFYAILVTLLPSGLRSQQTKPVGEGQSAQSQQAGAAESGNSTRDQKLSGLAVILKVGSVDGDPILQADGYRIRITSKTEVSFNGDKKTIADVGPDTWIRYEGTRDDTGVLVARSAKFFPPGTRKLLTKMGSSKAKQSEDYHPVERDSLIDADGHFANPHTKVRYSDLVRPCGWYRIPADQPLQKRVERIGMSLVPEYQKKLLLDHPSRIAFRFYAVADDKIRSVFACKNGLVLVPKNVVARLRSDDQLAAVLADGVALHLIRHSVSLSAADATMYGAAIALDITTGLPVLLASDALIGREEMLKLQRQCGRIALQLLADAGYDPWQAPEAWRLLEPKDLPADVSSLPYTREGKYQLDILNVQYKGIGSARTAAAFGEQR